MKKKLFIIDLFYCDGEDTVVPYLIPEEQIPLAEAVVSATKDEWLDLNSAVLCYDEFIEQKFRAVGVIYESVEYEIALIDMSE